MRTYTITCFILLIAVVLFLPCGEASASDTFYSIQAGTYAMSAIKFAGKQFDLLSKQLQGSELDYLRVEKGTKYYIVRIGRFRDRHEAIQLAKKVRTIVPDAFVLKQENFGALQIVRLYKKPAPVLEEYYTLQTGNFLEKEKATEQFESLGRSVMGDALRHLRIEKAGDYYSVRLGKFENYSLAHDFQKSGGDELAGAVIMKSFVRDEQILALFGEEERPKTSDVIVIDGKRVSVNDLSPGSELVHKNVSVNPEPVDAIIDEVSGYYDIDDFGKAAELLRKGLARWPDNPDLHAWYGATLLNMRFPEKAYEQYSKAVEMSPDVPDYHAGLGFSLLDIYMDKARNSIAAFQKALEIDPDNVSALEGLGIVYVTIDKKDLATDIYDQLREIDDDAADRLHQIITQGLEWEEE